MIKTHDTGQARSTGQDSFVSECCLTLHLLKYWCNLEHSQHRSQKADQAYCPRVKGQALIDLSLCSGIGGNNTASRYSALMAGKHPLVIRHHYCQASQLYCLDICAAFLPPEMSSVREFLEKESINRTKLQQFLSWNIKIVSESSKTSQTRRRGV